MAVFWNYIMTLQTMNVYIFKNYMETEWGDKEKGIISMTCKIRACPTIWRIPRA